MELVIGFILDLIIGDPNNPYHPVRGIGFICSKLEKIFRRILKNNLKIAGLIVWFLTIIITFSISFVIVYFAKSINNIFGIFVEGILIYFCISAKGLVVEGKKVIKYLDKNDIKGARKQLSYIVGRDTENLDEESIVRAVVETIAENMSDGVVAPIIFAGLFGASGAFLYKAVNTMDSMFGYKNDKYINFGYFPAKLDDVFNYIPARITGILIIITSFILGFNYKNSIKIYKRDKYNHTSPNSAHPESAMAGALEVQVGGANYYFGKIVKKPTIGDPIRKINIEDVKHTSSILYVSSVIAVIIIVAVKIVLL